MKKTYLIALALVIGTVFGFGSVAHANPFFFVPVSSTAIATSTLSYMTAGTATTTLVYDSYCGIGLTSLPCTSVAQPRVGEGAVLLLQFTSSSSAASLNVNFEYSQDAVDWYPAVNVVASTSAITNLNIGHSLTIDAASTTIAGVVQANNRTHRAVDVLTPVRFVRAVLTLPVGSTNGAVWASFVPRRQQAQ